VSIKEDTSDRRKFKKMQKDFLLRAWRRRGAETKKSPPRGCAAEIVDLHLNAAARTLTAAIFGFYSAALRISG
jgi:hypothetical protein